MASIDSIPRPSRSLAGKVAIVTGAGCPDGELGNGRAISILLAEDGASVVCVDLDLGIAERTSELVLAEAKGGRALALKADVTVAADCELVVQRTLAEFGRLDILVNNVGILGAGGTAVEADVELWAKGLEVNVTSMMLMAKHAVPAMVKNEPGDGSIRGSIINMGSVAGLVGGTSTLLYPTSKGAVVNMTRAMAAHHGKEGIRVNTVCPGTCSLDDGNPSPLFFSASIPKGMEIRV
jgi:NAD(P)-dependent dehydrogenase (short-subunit alcohol dehydrogenase family)